MLVVLQPGYLYDSSLSSWSNFRSNTVWKQNIKEHELYCRMNLLAQGIFAVARACRVIGAMAASKQKNYDCR